MISGIEQEVCDVETKKARTNDRKTKEGGFSGSDSKPQAEVPPRDRKLTADEVETLIEDNREVLEELAEL